MCFRFKTPNKPYNAFLFVRYVNIPTKYKNATERTIGALKLKLEIQSNSNKKWRTKWMH